MSPTDPEAPRLAGLILAAGQSRRMGTPKALLHLAGRPVLEHLVETFRDAQLAPIVVVASGVTLELATGVPGIELVEGDPVATMIDSVARGIERIEARSPAVVVQPVDAPFTTVEMLAALRAGSGQTVRVLCHDGRPGHPVLIPRSLYREVRERPEGGLRSLLARYDVELVEWPNDAVLADLDTPADVLRWERAHGRPLH